MIATLKNNQIHVTDCFTVKDYIKAIPGRAWSSKSTAWVLPVTIEAIDSLTRIPGRIDPSIFDEYRQLKQLQSENQEIRFAEKVEPIEPMPLKPNIVPFQHQIKGYNMALKNNGFGLLFEMGCGKSITSVAIAGRRYERGEIKKVLIAAPTSVLPVWEREFEVATIKYQIKILEGTSQKKIQALKGLNGEGLQIAVINYESTWRLLDELITWGPDMVIADESQRIKSPSAQQSKAMHKLGKSAKYKLILSGTPVQNAPLDFFSQYKLLDEKIFGTSYYAFKTRYAVMGGYGNHQIVGYNNLDELVRKAHSIALRVTKDEALDLPETMDEFRYCELDSKAKKIYEQIRDDSIAELEAGEVTARNVLTKLLRLQQITGGYLKLDDGVEKQISDSKLLVLEEIVEDVVDSGKKVVIFARFVSEIKAILKMVEKKKIDYRWIAGEVPIEERGEQVRVFQEDKNCKVFVAQIQTAGLGITLHAADTAVFYSVDFNYANYSQARARIHRIGQKNSCTYIHLLAKGTVDEKVMKALQKKEDMAKMVVDNWRMYFEK